MRCSKCMLEDGMDLEKSLDIMSRFLYDKAKYGAACIRSKFLRVISGSLKCAVEDTKPLSMLDVD